MPFILIKNNLKLMLRSKWILFLMIIFPLVCIALLSNAFKNMMETSFDIGKIQVGYRISENNTYKELLPTLEKACKSNGVILQEYPQGDISDLLKNKIVAVFVEISDENSFVLYQSNDKKAEAAITQSIFSDFFYKVNEEATVNKYRAEHGLTGGTVQKNTKVISEILNTDPVPSSIDYYGIIYIVYFAWCGMVSLVAVITSERKSVIPKRMMVSQMAKWKYYMGKFVPCTLAVLIEICSAWILSVLFFNIHWGEIGLSILIILLIAMATSGLGIVLFELFQNVAVSITIGFISTWIAGFFGGSFEAYMYSDLPKKLVKLSPLYYINRTLVEFSTKGYSDYTGRCLVYLISIIGISAVIGILLMYRKMEDQ